MSYSVTTTAATNGAIAWNSVGTSVHKGDTGPATATDDLMAAAESPRTGLTVSNDVPQIVKATSTPTFTQVGDQVQYTFDVTNNAGADLPSVTVADAFTDAPAGATPPTVTCDSVSGEGSCTGATTAAIPSGETAHFVATYVVTQADLDHGSLIDVATATGTTAGGGTISNTSNAVTVSAAAVHDFTLQKIATPTVVSDTSTPITYSFLLENNGNQALHGVTVTDPMLGAAVTCPSATIAAGASETCTGTYTPTQADLDAGSIDNSATAGALDPANGAVGDTSSFTVAVTQNPSLTLTKTATPISVGAVGDSVGYAFHVVNDGNVTMSAVTVTESAFSGSGTAPTVDCPAGPITLAPGDAEDCTASYLVTQADLDAGSITNTATVDGTDPSGATLTAPPTSSAAVSVVQTAALTLTETVDAPKATAAGQVLHYTFHVENTGNVSITGLTVQETGFTGTGGAPTVTCPTTALAPGDSTDCTASYTVQTADLKLARIDNPASATGVTAGGSVAPATSTTQVIVDPPVIPPVASALAATGLVADAAYGIASGLGLLGLGLVLLILRRRRSA
ncbi:hypothetical protein GCM10025881_14080 [Pseudolysinimonas kribbensis]|uniref:Gram-positive cocci surface proteins LPxTG domain-containing protein n=1 Tax=Pseudolysinimonas kribbensis TaxID=433641 RepID=A0ABQ6K577_9MICO|nr:hypothetical protein GCM10025881_14080 [Pseudolysinimonas kribbensis]